MAGLEPIGRWLIVAGLITALVGVVMVFGDRIPFIARLPGDIVYRGKNTTVYFPIVTSIVLSVVVSIVLYVIGRLGR